MKNHFFQYFPSIIKCDNLTLQTRSYLKRAMEPLEQNQAALRGYIDVVKRNIEETKDMIDQLTCAIASIMAKNEENVNRGNNYTQIPTLMDNNPLLGFVTNIQRVEVEVAQ